MPVHTCHSFTSTMYNIYLAHTYIHTYRRSDMPVVVSCLDSDSSSVQLELRPADVRFLVGLSAGRSGGGGGSPRGPPIAVQVTAVQVAGCYMNFVKCVRRQDAMINCYVLHSEDFQPLAMCVCTYVCMPILFTHFHMYVYVVYVGSRVASASSVLFCRLLRMTKFSSIFSVEKVATSNTSHHGGSGGGAVAAAPAAGSDDADSLGDRSGHSTLAGLEMISWDEFKALFCTDLKTLQCHFGAFAFFIVR